MPFTDYFLAPDDVIAGAALGDGGPVSTELPTVEAKGVDPVVNLGHLEAILTGRPYDVVVAQPRQGRPVGDVSGEQIIVAVTDTLRDALAAATPAALEGAGARLAATEELAGADPAGVTDFLRRLAGLAGRADGWHLYCYWAL
ncbi:hypothetical protein [Paractinoplanes atraurantiacus]|nr:hypothetical protein [Actinoplanes atraurantiacus]